jgi:hypothetical protein
VSVAEFFTYLIVRVPTLDLGLQLVAVYDERQSRRAATPVWGTA